MAASNDNPWLQREVDAEAYAARFAARAAAGEDVHGEASAVQALLGFWPARVLDAGCGTGRVALELARRGGDVAGVDIDERMLAVARRSDPTIPWYQADLATLELEERFDAIVAAGNVMIFMAPGSEAAAVAAMARHLVPGGLLIAGFQRGRAYDIAEHDVAAAAAGLRLRARYATWDQAPFDESCDYAVSVHQRAQG